jgi:hypothetical protein
MEKNNNKILLFSVAVFRAFRASVMNFHNSGPMTAPA